MSAQTVRRNRPQLLTAEDVSNEIDRISDEADQVGEALDDADARATEARSEYEYAFSRAFVKADGSIDLRKHKALIQTHGLRTAADTADLIVRQLRRRLDRISRIHFEGIRTKSASHRAETASFGPGSAR